MTELPFEASGGLTAQQLLQRIELRRSELEAVQEVVRLLAPKTGDTPLLISVASILRSCFGVEKLAYIHTFTPNRRPRLAYFHNFPSISQDAIRECLKYTITSVPEPDSFLAHMGVEIIMPLGRFVGPSARVRIVEPQAWWLLGSFAETEEEEKSDLIYLEIIGSIITVYLENAFFQEQQRQAEILRLQQQAYEQEIRLASRIQRRILSATTPGVHPRLDIATFHVAYKGVGGDLFDFIRVSDREVLFYMGDVSGKGISAALVMSNLQGHIRTLAELGLSLPKMLAQLHRRLLQIYGREEDSGFVTLFLAKLTLEENGEVQLEYYNAGHPPAFLISAQRGLIPLPANLTPIGIHIPGHEHRLEATSPQNLTGLQPGDILFAYTDGLIEQPSPTGEDLGLERLERYLSNLGSVSSDELLARVRKIIDEYRQTKELQDDMSLLACRIL
ncbi:MAG: serine/threonine-protein phosphatase [Bacteroidia bacterium]|nr:serine/threonine-protein phosphatase [Bacteroidia bacterium]MDW8089454.1 PP2C family protein-serine/threonine phosphatase [Bacteroidia bacterium]